LAALSLSFPVFFVVLAVGSGLSQGTTALLANALGAGDLIEARRVFAQSLIFAAAAGVLLTSLGWIAAPWLFRQLGAEGGYLTTVLAYMNVVLGGALFFLLPMVINAALAAQGNARPYRNFLFAGFAANIILNPVLMWGWSGLPALGVGGIALATVLVQLAGAIFLWRHAMGAELMRDLKPADFRPNARVLQRIAGQAVPAALNMLTVALGVFVITWFVQHFGKEAVAHRYRHPHRTDRAHASNRLERCRAQHRRANHGAGFRTACVKHG
jgi:Na+-driven multidrug efflux pump